MKKSIVIAFAMVAISTPAAFAADLASPKSTKVIPVAKSQSWTSCYIGGNIGGATSKTDVVDEISGAPIASLDSSAISGGGQIGCDYQLPGNSPLVLGIQGMVDATGLSDSTTNGNLEALVLDGEIPWVATLTARLGYAVSSDLLVYGKGGAAWAHTKATLTSPEPSTDSVSFNQNGWTVGAGAEYRLNQNLSLFAEYNYLALADKTPVFPSFGDVGTVQQDVQLFLVGANLRFAGF